MNNDIDFSVTKKDLVVLAVFVALTFIATILLQYMAELLVNYHLLQKKGDESLEALLEKLLLQGEKEVKIISVFMTKGFEFSRMKNRVLAYKHKFNKVSFSSPILKGRKRICSFAAFLINEYKLDRFSNYIFVGHGLPGSKNREYFALEKALKKQGFGNAKVALLMGKTFNGEFIFSEKKVTVIPLLISCGKHIKQDIFGDDGSFCAELESKGFEVEKRIASLDMSERFVREFLK